MRVPSKEPSDMFCSLSGLSAVVKQLHSREGGWFAKNLQGGRSGDVGCGDETTELVEILTASINLAEYGRMKGQNESP